MRVELKNLDEVTKKMVEKVQHELDIVLNDIGKNREVWDMMDLKMHDASFKAYELDKIDEFSDWCSFSYDAFEEWIMDTVGGRFDEWINRIGRTSKFYLGTFDRNVNGRFGVVDGWSCCWFLDNLISGYACMSDYFDINGKGEIVAVYFRDYDEDEVKCALEDFEEIVDRLMDEWNEYKRDYIKIYDYIKDSKEHQVEYFLEFIDEQ